MSKVTVASLSMMIGLLLGLSLSGNHMTIVAQTTPPSSAPSLQATPATPPSVMSFPPCENSYSGTPPTIPPLSCRELGHVISKNDPNAVGPIVLDGKYFKDGTFDNVVFVYSGGAVTLDNMKLDTGTIRLRLEGAAANTVRFLSVWEQIGKTPNVPVNPNVPAVRTVSISQPTMMNVAIR